MEGIVLSAAKGAVGTLLGKLGSLLTQEAQLLQGVRDEIQFVKDELECMNAFLQSYERMEDHNDQITVWMKQVRDMAYDAEDCIDEFIHHIGEPCGRSFKGLLRRGTRLLRTLKARRQIAVDIQSLNARALHMNKRRSRYGQLKVSTNKGTTSFGATSGDPQFVPRLLSPYIFEHVGIEGPIGELVSLMKENVPQLKLKVIFIVGFGGLGKTTLALKGYQSPEAKSGRFECRAFVTVSQTFKMNNLLMEILRQVKPAEKRMANTRVERHNREDHLDLRGIKRWGHLSMERWELKQLKRKLTDHLNDKRYLIVLDDIWNVSTWKDIRSALPDNKKNTRIIVTTRNETVANTCNLYDHDYIYKMKPLSQLSSKQLFFKRVFGSLIRCPAELEELSDAILKKCGGVPLAIVSIGGILASKDPKTKEEWEKVNNRLNFESETSLTLERMRKVLTLSCNDLPYHLKACFLHLSNFPGKYEINWSMLQRRWVVEGFVCGQSGLSASDVAESYFNEFICRSIIQPVRIGLSGKVRSFKIHDMMLQIIVSKSIEENFIFLQGGNYMAMPLDKVRRLSVHGGLNHKQASISASTMTLSHVRSLTMFGSDASLVLTSLVPPRVLRVLDLTNCRDLQNYHLKSICKILRLKYLSLRCTNIDVLPEEIGKLQDLETLDIKDTYISKLPTGVVKLQQLKHLLCGFSSTPRSMFNRMVSVCAPQGIGKMPNLQKLYNVEFSSSTVMQELGELMNLRKLGIKINTEEGIVPTLHHLSSSLSSLTLSTKEADISLNFLNTLSSPPLHIQTLNLQGHLSVLPNWIVSLWNVTKITLQHTRLQAENDARVLEDLPRLQSLSLLDSSFTREGQLYVKPNGFPMLKFLQLRYSEISTIIFKKGAAPKLEKFICIEIRMKIRGIIHLPKIEEIGVGKDMMNAVRRVARTNPNHLKVTEAS